MLFSSIEFLFLFLPVVLAGYCLLPFRHGLKNLWLLAASLCFYAWGEPRFVFAMIASIAFNYLMALGIEAMREHGNTSGAKLFLVSAIVGNLLLLGVYKYLNFATATLRAWFPAWQGAIPQTSILLPLGISFFTFQALSYVVDVSRGEPAQRNPLLLALYIAFFPQLIAGPIVRYTSVIGQLRARITNWDQFTRGVFRFVAGFNKKMLLANVMAEVADAAFATKAPSMLFAWFGAVAYTLQIYFDFSGYSDMAIGLAKMFGIEIPENFNYPYMSKSVTEFWRRWHISLGTWFRDYVYFPLGGSRVGRWRLAMNLMIVWVATGIWHGANWTFITWGTLYGVLIMLEKLSGWAKRVDSSKVLGTVYRPFTLLVVILGFVLFRSDNLSDAVRYFAVMFGTDRPVIDGCAIFWCRETLVPFIVAVLASTSLLWRITSSHLVAVGYVLQFAMFIISISCLVMNVHNPFIYFNF